MHPARQTIDLLLADCEVERTRRGGPGGQHRNKVETAIVIKHRPTGVTAQAGERRSQHANREVAIQRLRLNLAVEYRTNVDSDRTPHEIWSSRVNQKRISISAASTEFAVMIAEALDFVAAAEFDVAAAAKRLNVSTSQLIKLLAKHRPAFERLNVEREKRDRHRLKSS